MSLSHRLNLDSCRERQVRFGKELETLQVDYALLVQAEHVQYLTGFRPSPVHQSAVIVFPGGETILCSPNQAPDNCAANQILSFEAQWNCTLRQDQLAAALQTLSAALSPRLAGQRMGAEGSANALILTPWETSRSHPVVDLEPTLWKLRRRKDPDELQMIQRAIACTEAMYQRAREIIQPGISELEVYCQLHTAAVLTAGEPLLAVGNDFQCNSPGGPPRQRKAEQGELYILDLGVSYRGYFSDNCRTFCVGAAPDNEQRRAWEAIVGVLEYVENKVRPGTSARDLYLHAHDMLAASSAGEFFHHLGHGIGLFPHEGPHLNDRWDDTFEEGDVFTAEPGLYSPKLRAGIRLEQDYIVTATGVERLTNFPLDL